MLKFLESNSTTVSQETFTNKFTNKKILVMGSGPSVNLVNWKTLNVDAIVTTSFFYLNDEIRKLSNITHVTLSDVVDLEHPNLIEFIENNPTCTFAFEPKMHPFYQSDKFRQFVEKYKEQVIYYNTEYGKIEGVAGRVCYFVMQFFPDELYYVGIDGHNKNRNDSPNNAFRTNLIDADNGLHSYEKFVEAHEYFANILYQTSLQTKTKLYNLGEGFEFNCSTAYSLKHFPLNNEIKQRIKL